MKSILAALGVFILVSCNTRTKQSADLLIKRYPNLEKAGWMIGTWENVSPEGSLTETWKKANDSVYNGRTCFTAGNDTLFTETIRLEEADGSFAYVTAVSNQNGGNPVRFDMTSITDDQIIFENPAHDFPQKITYNRINNDSLVAQISGKRKGKQAFETFPMKRRK